MGENDIESGIILNHSVISLIHAFPGFPRKIKEYFLLIKDSLVMDSAWIASGNIKNPAPFGDRDLCFYGMGVFLAGVDILLSSSVNRTFPPLFC